MLIDFYVKKIYENKKLTCTFMFYFFDKILYECFVMKNYNFEKLEKEEAKELEKIKKINDLIFVDYFEEKDDKENYLKKNYVYENEGEETSIDLNELLKIKHKKIEIDFVYPQCGNCYFFKPEEQYCLFYKNKLKKEKLFCRDFFKN